jgi:flagellar motor switch protein FliN
MPGMRPRSTISPHFGHVASGRTVDGVRNLLQCTHHGTDPVYQAAHERPQLRARHADREAVSVHEEVRTRGEIAAAFVGEIERILPDTSLTVGEVCDVIPDVFPEEQVRVLTLTFTSRERADGVLAMVARTAFAASLERAASDELLATASGNALGAATRALATVASLEVAPNSVAETDLESLVGEIGDSAVVVYPIASGDDVVAWLAVTIDETNVVTDHRGNGSASRADDDTDRHAAPMVLADVEMGVTAELGRCQMTVRELLSLTPGAIIDLDRSAGALVDVLVNGTLIARGEVVVIDEEFGIRISELVKAGAERT